MQRCVSKMDRVRYLGINFEKKTNQTKITVLTCSGFLMIGVFSFTLGLAPLPSNKLRKSSLKYPYILQPVSGLIDKQQGTRFTEIHKTLLALRVYLYCMYLFNGCLSFRLKEDQSHHKGA